MGMKKTIFIVALGIIGLCLSASKAEAKGIPIPVSFGGEKLMTVVDLPNDTLMYSTAEGAYCNLGYKYKQFSVIWVPAWNWDGEYCLTVEGKPNTYYTLSDEDLAFLTAQYDLDLPNNPISFWNKIGGKIIWLLAIALIIWSWVKPKEEKDDDGDGTSELPHVEDNSASQP